MTNNIISLVAKREEKKLEKEEEFTAIKYLEGFLQELKEKKINLKQIQIIFSEETNDNSLIRYVDFNIKSIQERIGLLECAKHIIFDDFGTIEDND